MKLRSVKRYLGGTLAVAILALPLIVVACGGEEVVEEVAETVEWGYSGAGAPENWASISEDNASCGNGAQQSPIDITGYQQAGVSPPISFSYRKEAESVTNLGTSVAVRTTRPATVSVSESAHISWKR